MKNIRIFIKKPSVFGVEIFDIFKSACFHNVLNLIYKVSLCDVSVIWLGILYASRTTISYFYK